MQHEQVSTDSQQLGRRPLLRLNEERTSLSSHQGVEQLSNQFAPEDKGQGLSHREEALAAIGQTLDNLRYGTIILTVHDSRVVQLEVTEKTRFGK
jgi:hypothetical protein